nr:MAG TPA: hypothetical protein [Caudoviricetes sp.]
MISIYPVLTTCSEKKIKIIQIEVKVKTAFLEIFGFSYVG